MTTAETVRALRQKAGLTQAAFAALYEIPKRTLENWEAGVRTPPPYVVRLLEAAVNAKTEAQECQDR